MKMFVYSMREYDELMFYKTFANKYNIEFDYTTDYPTLENYHLAKGFDAISIITTATDSNMIDYMKEQGVKVIATRTIGYDHIDVDYKKKVGMGLTHVSYEPASVADYAIMLMLLGCRKMKFIMNTAAVQDFTLQGKLGVEISKSTVGVIGTGRIGKTVVKHLQGFGCRVLAYDIYPSDDLDGLAQYVDLETMYRECDILTLHAPATDDNYHLFNDESFGKMKDGVMIINCARGTLIDTSSLIRNLNSGKIGFAAVDVLENETGLYYLNKSGEIIDNPEMAVLKTYQNVIVSPHTAFYTEEAVSNMVEYSITGALAYLNGQESQFIIS